MTALPARAIEPGTPAHDLLPPDQLHAALIITAGKRGDGEHPQRRPLASRVAQLPGDGQRPAAVLGPLGEPAAPENVSARPARASASTRDGPQSPAASRTAVK